MFLMYVLVDTDGYVYADRYRHEISTGKEWLVSQHEFATQKQFKKWLAINGTNTYVQYIG